MSPKDIFGFLSVVSQKPGTRDPIQMGNVSFKDVLRRRSLSFWNNNTGASNDPVIGSCPFKMDGLVSDDTTVGHGFFREMQSVFFTSPLAYPLNPSGSTVGTSTYDYSKFRATGVLTTIPATDVPRVIGSLLLHDNLSVPTGLSNWGAGNSLAALNDVPKTFTQIGTVYLHPAYATGVTVSTSIGLSYVTFTGSSIFDLPRFQPGGGFNLIRLHTGSDAGFYFIHHVDFLNNRLYLRCLDGSMFAAIATNASVGTTIAPGRRAYFNETSIIPLGTGTVAVGGTFVPGAARDSFIMRIVFDKTGSTEAAVATEQQGSYYVTMKPYTHGDGIVATNQEDSGSALSGAFAAQGSAVVPFNFQFFDGGASAITLDESAQRVWFGYTNASTQSGIACWRWKTVESFREVANYLGTAGHASFLTPAITLGAGDFIRSAHTGSTGINYFIIGHATSGNGGVVVINANLTTSQYRLAQGIPNSNLSGGALDKSRARTGTAADTSTNGANQITSASGAFTAADVGRCISITGATGDNGTYKIATIVSGTQVTVTTPAGGAVTFTTQTGGTFQIGDRLYLMFNNNTTGAGQINFMESLAPGVFHTRAVSMTNGANCNVQIKPGEPCRVDVDPSTGDVYWLSNDTQQQINKYLPLTNTHEFRTIADVASPSGQVGTVGTITTFTAVKVNPKFDEVWVGTDQGHVKLVKSAFTGANYKRYFGNDSANYANPTGFPRGDGSASASGLSGAQDTRHVRFYAIRVDGRVISGLMSVSGQNVDLAHYHRDGDLFVASDAISSTSALTSNMIVDSYGRWFMCCPGQAGQWRFSFGGHDIHYQWDNANTRWIPLEIAPSNLPNKSVSDTFSPGLTSRPIHSTAEPVLYGVTVQFNRQGGATPPNNEFLGRAGQTGVARTDGSTTSGLSTFNGSSFVSGDVGRILRIESGADAGMYKITVFTSSTLITISRMNGTAVSAAATASSLSYSVWDLGAVGSTAGPEDATVLLANGFSKDNTQDLLGISYESYFFKAAFADNTDSIKFCIPTKIGVSGSSGSEVYYETFTRTASQYQPSIGQHRALPGSPFTNGDAVIDNFIDKANNGAGGRPNIAPATTAWNGILASTVHGASLMVDLGADADVGYVVVRFAGNVLSGANTAFSSGFNASLFNDPASGGAPIASSVVRTSGTSTVNGTLDVSTITLTSGDFLGATVVGLNTDGVTVAGSSTFTAGGGTFLASHVGMILQITTGSDAGSYRILTVGGATCTIENLNQTSRQWVASASSLSYNIRDGVRPYDKISIPNNAAPTYELAIERLLTTTSAQVRTPPHATFSNQNWQVMVPSWNLVKRLSFSTDAAPPDVKNNGTWMSVDGQETGVFTTQKMYFDLTDLTSGQRTGRYWKLNLQPRFESGSGSYTFTIVDMEFFNTSGVRLNTAPYLFSDQAWSNPDFLSNHVHRVDFIQASNTAVGGAFNGNASLSTLGVVTLSGGNKFLGFQVRTDFTDGNPISGGNTFISSSAAFTTADVGRFIRVTSGANSGVFYRIVTRVSATQVTVALPSGTAVSFGATETGILFAIHEGIANGGSAPDYINFGAVTGADEFTITSVNDALTQLTVAEVGFPALTSVAFEIRRRGFDTTSATTDATKTARLVRPNTTYPVQSGDVAHDSRGALRFFTEDVGAAATRSSGSITGGSGVFTGTLFSQDDVGRILTITTGVNVGSYRISAFSSATSITVVNLITGAAVSFTADAGPVTYRIYGERRFRLAKYVYCLKA